jgi:hypothetical protein
MFRKIKKLLGRRDEETGRAVTEEELGDLLKNLISSADYSSPPSAMHSTYLSVWECGPRGPGENYYNILRSETDEDGGAIKLFLEDGEECIIEKPSEIVLAGGQLKINKAEKITWKYYYSGELSPEMFVSTEYIPLDNARVRIVDENKYNPIDEMCDVSGKPALILWINPKSPL